MKNLFVFIIAIVSGLIATAQNNPITQTIRGTIIDHQSGNTLKAATIQLVNSKNNSTVSDSSGAFKLTNVPIGRQHLKITLVGYEDASVQNIEVTSTKEVLLDISLHGKVAVPERSSSYRVAKKIVPSTSSLW
jgi:hypothetical protein